MKRSMSVVSVKLEGKKQHRDSKEEAQILPQYEVDEVSVWSGFVTI